MTTGEKIAELRKKFGMTQPQLAEFMNVSQSTITMWENSRRAVSTDDLSKLADHFHVSTDYLLGRTNKKGSASDGTDFVIASDSVPVYGEIHAGAAAWAEQDIIGKVPITRDTILRYGRDNLFALRIKGDSMNHVLLDGYLGVFSKDCPVENGDIVAVLLDHEDATVKRYKETSMAVTFEPDSTNPSYKPYFFSKAGNQDFEVLGKLLFVTTQII